MRKKHAAGADCLITQVGWDMDKPVELLAYRRRVGFCQPVLVSCMALSAPMARALHAGRVPGIVVTGDLLALAEREATAPDRGRAAQIERLALQIVGVERLGFAGVQLSGLLKADDVRRLLARVDTWRQQLATVEAWRLTWDERLRLPSGRVARTAPEQGFGVFDPFVVSASPADPWDRRRYRVLESIHRLVFTPRSPVARLLRPVARRIRPESRIARWLARLEHRIKGPLVDCRLCGYCRLPATFYICPESCPKGLANGPCGGSTGNACEADDRTCVHARVYRLAKAAGCLDRLERTIVPAAPRQPGGSSWLEFFAGRMPESFEG